MMDIFFDNRAAFIRALRSARQDTAPTIYPYRWALAQYAVLPCGGYMAKEYM